MSQPTSSGSTQKDSLHQTNSPWGKGRKVEVITQHEAAKRKILALLNKLTADKFDTITRKLVDLLRANQALGVELLRDTVTIIFDKALGETFFANIYSDMCQKISVEVSDLFIPHYTTELKLQNEAAAMTARAEARTLATTAGQTGSKDDIVAAEMAEEKAKKAEQLALGSIDEKKKKNMFRAILLNECQREFQNGVQEIKDETKTSIELEDLRNAQKRRMLGNIRFIGELYKKGMVIEIIIHVCTQHLLKDQQNPLEEDLEALCRLLTTIGKQLDNPRSKQQMDVYFQQIQTIIEQIELSSRIRYMLLDLQDLRKNKWIPRDVKIQ
jgi:translation initiation factor 4G